MATTSIVGSQIRVGTIARDRVDATFEAQLALIEANVTSIFNTMSTDAERMAAIDALTTAFQNADSTLQGAITSMVNATKAGAGLQPDGSYLLPVGQTFLTGATSIAQAVALLDVALKAEQDARTTADTTIVTNLTTLINNSGSDGAAALAAAVAAQLITDTAQDTALAAEIARAQAAEAANATATSNEVTRAQAAEAALAQAVTDEAAARTSADAAEATARNTAISTAVAAEATARDAAIAAEATARDAAIGTAVSAEASARDAAIASAVSAEATARSNADAAEATARDAAITTAVAAEATARDTAIGVAVAAEATARDTAVTAEASARVAGDEALDARIDALESAGPSGLTYDKFINRETPVGNIDGVNALFTVAFDVHAGSENVYVNGLLQEPGAGNDYTISGKEITLTYVPVVGDRVKVSYFR